MSTAATIRLEPACANHPDAAHGRTPKVSIILPTRNRQDLLARAIASVRSQTFEDWELLVIDDASIDRSALEVERQARVDQRIRLVEPKSSLGPAAARNLGISLAVGEYVAFLDDDDEWLPDKLALQVCALENTPDAAFVYSSYKFVVETAHERTYGLVDASGQSATPMLLRGNFIGNSTVVVDRSILETVGGFDERMPPIEDWDLWLRVSAKTRFAFVAEPTVRINFSPGSVTSWKERRRSACHRLAERLPALAGDFPGGVADGYYAIAYVLLTGGLSREGRAYLRRSLRLMPWLPQRWIMAIVAHAGEGPYRTVTDLHRAVVSWWRAWRVRAGRPACDSDPGHASAAP